MHCLCVNVCCHRVTTQLQLINISYHITYHISYHISYHTVSYHISYHILSYIILYHISYHEFRTSYTHQAMLFWKHLVRQVPLPPMTIPYELADWNCAVIHNQKTRRDAMPSWLPAAFPIVKTTTCQPVLTIKAEMAFPFYLPPSPPTPSVTIISCYHYFHLVCHLHHNQVLHTQIVTGARVTHFM